MPSIGRVDTLLRCVYGNPSNRVEGQCKRLRISPGREAQVRWKSELSGSRDTMQTPGEFVLADHAQREVAGAAVRANALQAQPADVDRERATAEVRKGQAVLREEFRSPV